MAADKKQTHVVSAITALMDIASSYPGLRVGQIIENVMGLDDDPCPLYYIENDELAAKLLAYHVHLGENYIKVKRKD